MLCLAKTLIGWLALMLVGTNLVGFVVPGFVHPQAVEDLTAKMDPVVAKMAAKDLRASRAVSYVFVVITALVVYVLFRVWNAGVALVAVMLMAAYIPDSVWQIRTGQKARIGSMPKGTLHTLVPLLLQWGALPILWYSLCSMAK